MNPLEKYFVDITAYVSRSDVMEKVFRQLHPETYREQAGSSPYYIVKQGLRVPLERVFERSIARLLKARLAA